MKRSSAGSVLFLEPETESDRRELERMADAGVLDTGTVDQRPTGARAEQALRRAVIERAYSPGQKRDNVGRFGSGTGGPGAAHSYDPGQLDAPNDMDDFGPDAQQKFMDRAHEIDHGFPETPDEMATVLLDTYDRATPDQIADGERWYQDAHDNLGAEAGKYATGPRAITVDQTYAVAALCSPRTVWAKNVQQTNAILEVYHGDEKFTIDKKTYDKLKNKTGVDGPGEYRPSQLSGDQLSFAHPKLNAVKNLPFGDHCEAAFKVLRGEPIDTVVSGVKIRNFYNNIRRPGEPHSVTIDSWQVRGMVKPGIKLPIPWYETKTGADGKKTRIKHDITMSDKATTQTYFDKPSGKKVGINEDTGMYPYFGTAAHIATQRLAARKNGRKLTPQQLQAITWLVAKDSGVGGEE